MDHLQLRCGRLHTLDVANITYEILTYYGDAAGICEYINIIEDSQKKAQRAQLPITDVTLMTITAKLILQAHAFTPDP